MHQQPSAAFYHEHVTLRGEVQRSSCSTAAVWAIQAIDAAQSFDFESKAAARVRNSKSLKIGIVGFGTFGRFLAKRIVAQGHEVWHARFCLLSDACVCMWSACADLCPHTYIAKYIHHDGVNQQRVTDIVPVAKPST